MFVIVFILYKLYTILPLETCADRDIDETFFQCKTVHTARLVQCRKYTK